MIHHFNNGPDDDKGIPPPHGRFEILRNDLISLSKSLSPIHLVISSVKILAVEIITGIGKIYITGVNTIDDAEEANLELSLGRRRRRLQRQLLDKNIPLTEKQARQLSVIESFDLLSDSVGRSLHHNPEQEEILNAALKQMVKQLLDDGLNHSDDTDDSNGTDNEHDDTVSDDDNEP